MNLRIIKAIMVIMAMIAVYSIFTAISASQQLKTLRVKMEHTTDSLNRANRKYELLAMSYDSVAFQLSDTRDYLIDFRQNVDAIMQSNIRSVGSLREALHLIMKNYQPIDSLTINSNEDLEFPI